jgi:RimJ/RimL family protein N-acetyltransferase
MNLHRVDLRVLAFNDGAIAAYRKWGFVAEGRERESCWLDGQWHDDIIMGLLAAEFPGPA